MKFYIASRTRRKKEVKKIFNILKNLGNEITHDWTRHRNIRPYEKHKKLASSYAVQDINGVKECDVFILLNEDEPGFGMNTELGAAIASYLSSKKPKIYIVGGYQKLNMFYYHPAVLHRETIYEVLEDLNST